MLDEFDATLRGAGVGRAVNPHGPVIDIAFRVDGEVRRYFSTVTTLGTAMDITLQELRIELFHPSDTPR
jgi:hypothetical protein